MDWHAAIEQNREALRRIVAALVAMAALAGGNATTSPLWGGRREAAGGGSVATIAPTRRSDDSRPPHKGEVEAAPALTLPRHLHRAVAGLLRPAEAATRRLIIVAARGIVVAPPRPRPAKPRTMTMEPLLRGFGIAVVMSPADLARAAAARRAAALHAGRSRTLSLPLLDPLTRWSGGRARKAATTAPRLSVPGLSERRPARQPPTPDDPVSAARLSLRLAALASALDDLPAQARRFARWRAAREAKDARERERAPQGRFEPGKGKRRRGPYDRVSALKPGNPPGWRRKPSHEVHEVLDTVHGLAVWALEPRDTS